MNKKAKKTMWSDYIIAVLAAIVGVGLITQSSEVSQGIRDGIAICAGTLIPALFPFMALSGFLSLTSAARILSVPLTPVTTKLFKLPADLGAIVLLSLIGGYPVGAKSISLLLAQGKIEKHTAERMLCFCVNSGPSFLITAVGAGMLFNKTAGIILFATQTAATLIIGAAVSRRAKVSETKAARAELRGIEAFVAAVSGASSAMLVMCAFAVLFSGILSMISASGFVALTAGRLGMDAAILSAVISGFLEVTAGCASASKIGGTASFLLISAIASFGGLSVLFQIMSCFRETSIRFAPLILARISHMFLSVAMAAPLYEMFCETQAVFANSAKPLLSVNTQTAVISLCLLGMCAVMTLSGTQSWRLPKRKKSYKIFWGE